MTHDRDADLNTAMALTQRLLKAEDQGRADLSAPERAHKDFGLGQNLRYWLWRAGGRQRSQLKSAAHVSRLLDNYEIELERLRQNHGRDLIAQKQAHDHVIAEIEATHQQSLNLMRASVMNEVATQTEKLDRDLVYQRERVAQLEQLTAEFQRVYQQELARSRAAGFAEAQADLDAAQDRITGLEEELAHQQRRHDTELRERLDEAGLAAEAAEIALRRELEVARDTAATELATARRQWEEQRAAEAATWEQRLAEAEQRHRDSLVAAERGHDGVMTRLRTAQAEELAELRTASEWSLSDTRRQITDLKLRLNEQEDAHTEEMDLLREQHRQELAEWLDKFEHAQQQQEIRHAGEYAGTLQAQRQTLAEAQGEAARQSAEADALRQELAETQRRLDALSTQWEAGQAETAARERQWRVDTDSLNGQSESLRQQLATLDSRAQAAEARAEELAQQLAQDSQDHAARQQQWHEQVEQLNAELAQARAASGGTEQLAVQCEEMRQQLVTLDSRARAAEARVETLDQQVTQDQRDHAARQQQWQEQLAQLNTALEQARAQAAADPARQQTELAQIQEEHTLALARLRLDSSRRIAELERRLAQAEKDAATAAPPPASEAIPEPAPQPSPSPPGIDWQARVQAALDRAARTEAELNLATNKIEVLKDALALAKARPGNGGSAAPVDTRFRDAKRAFARAFHPDQGGRDQPEKAALFLEFWPELERIERDQDEF